MKELTGILNMINEKNLKIQQLESELNNLRKLNASNTEMNKRTQAHNKANGDNKISELEETARDLREQIKRIKNENIDMEKIITQKQNSLQESERKLMHLKASTFHQESKKKVSDVTSDVDKMQAEYDALCLKKKQLLEIKNTKEAEHKLLKENLADYLKTLQQKFLGYLSTGNL